MTGMVAPIANLGASEPAADAAATLQAAPAGPPDVGATAEMPAYGQMLVNTLTTLTIMVIVLLVAAWVIRWLLRRRLAGLGSDRIELIGRKQLEPGKSLYLIRIGTRQLLIGSGNSGLTRIADLSDDSGQEAGPTQEEVSAGESGISFSQTLASSTAPSTGDPPDSTHGAG